MVTIVGQDAAGNHQRVPISPIAPKGEVPKPWEGPYFPYFPYFGGLCLLILPRKTLRGSLFPLLPLRVKRQNHERVPISPILVAHVLTRWKDMDHQNRGNRGNSLDIGWFMLQMWWLPWMKTCMIKNVFGIYGYWVNKCNPQTYKYN